MVTRCPYIDNCPMFKLFESNFTKAWYKIIYCLRDFESCVRKGKRDKGETIPDELLPNGHSL